MCEAIVKHFFPLQRYALVTNSMFVVKNIFEKSFFYEKIIIFAQSKIRKYEVADRIY